MSASESFCRHRRPRRLRSDLQDQRVRTPNASHSEHPLRPSSRSVDRDRAFCRDHLVARPGPVGERTPEGARDPLLHPRYAVTCRSISSSENRRPLLKRSSLVADRKLLTSPTTRSCSSIDDDSVESSDLALVTLACVVPGRGSNLCYGRTTRMSVSLVGSLSCVASWGGHRMRSPSPSKCP